MNKQLPDTFCTLPLLSSASMLMFYDCANRYRNEVLGLQPLPHARQKSLKDLQHVHVVTRMRSLRSFRALPFDL
jgi:hypothetical protein